MHELLSKVITEKNLSAAEAEIIMRHMVQGEHTTTEKAAFLCALRIKGETPEEIVGFSKALKAFASLERIPGVSDIVGTGGDGHGTINVSTAAAINAASLGVKIAKHGNRAVTSKMGSADFLERLGYEFQFTSEEGEKRLKSSNFLFILAPAFNRSFSVFSEARKRLQLPTIFNLMGPITNPADPDIMVIGSKSPDFVQTYANVLRATGKRGMVIVSSDGMDEISPYGTTLAYESLDTVRSYMIRPEEIMGRELTSRISITGNDAEEIFRKNLKGLSGENPDCARFIALNTSPILMLNGLCADLSEGYEIAVENILSGRAMRHLGKIIPGFEGGIIDDIQATGKGMRNQAV